MTSLDDTRARFAGNAGLPFADVLTEASIRAVLDEHGVVFRDRVFHPAATIWGFLSQVLSDDHSCRDAVARVLAHRAVRGLPACSPNTASYCEARGRLATGVLRTLARRTAEQLQAAAPAAWGWHGRRVLIADGSHVSMPDTAANQAAYPQVYNQAEDNMIVAYPSTPAQYFHILRRQAVRRPRKPLVLMQPKSLLRLPAATSRLEDLASAGFQPVIDDPVASQHRDAVQRLVFCTGKIYYDLVAAGERPPNVGIVRVEEMAPWPREVSGVVDLYANVEEVVWAQEEPKNMGPWTYVQPRLRASIGTLTTLRYIGRPERSSPAEGYKSSHDVEQARIIRDVLTYAPAARRKGGAGAAR